MAREPMMSPDVWSREAHDMVRMAIFAGFESKTLICKCLMSSKGKKVNVRTVERIMSEME